MMKIYKIFSARMAHELHELGFWIIGSEPNMKYPHLKVFLFEDTPKFREALSSLSK